MRTVAAFRMSTSSIALRTATLPRWMALFGFGIALLLLAWGGRISWEPMPVPVWTLLVSVQIPVSNLRGPGPCPAEPRLLPSLDPRRAAAQNARWPAPPVVAGFPEVHA